MAGVWNVNGIYDVNTKKVTSKLSFNVGEKFLARILSMDSGNSEILLKLLDGWQFPAKVEKPLQDMPQGMVRFQVVGLEDGKLKLAMVSKKDEDTNSKDSISDTAKSLGLTDDTETHDMLQKMVKHNIPLTRDNIGKVKTIIDFKNKMNKSPEEADTFIEKYIESKGIDPKSEKAGEIRENLKNFFSSIKDMDKESILTLIDNDIELTGNNIESFNKLFNNKAVIYEGVKELASKLKSAAEENTSQVSDKNVESGLVEKETIESKTDFNFSKLSSSDDKIKDLYKHLEKFLDKSNDNDEIKSSRVDLKTVDSKKMDQEQSKPSKVNEQYENTTLKKSENDLKFKKLETNIKTDEDEAKSDLGSTQGDAEAITNDKTMGSKDTLSQVKNELSQRTEELKTMIKDIIDTKDKIKPEVFDKVFEAVKENINDFKVFNSLSNQYYYMDMPVKVNNNEYGCRLLIKDDRKKDKKIDSKNVKIAASVKTINMGTVNAFIKVNNLNMNVNIKCDESFIDFINAGKTKLYEELSNLGYNTSVNVEKKEEEVDIAGCSDFFDDNSSGALDTKV